MKEDFRPCMAPWRAISIRPSGRVLPDGQYRKSFGNINESTISELLTSETAIRLKKDFESKQFNNGCISCREKEKSIGHSRRIFFEHKLGSEVNTEMIEVNEEPDIRYLDLNLSSKCNLKCRMCSSISSSSWVSEELKLLKVPNRQFRIPTNPQYHTVDFNKVEEAFNDPTPFRNLRYIALQGGEPLLEDGNFRILQKIVDWGISDQVTIELSTNGTQISKEIQSLIRHFKSVDMYISIEAAGDLYQYIRGGDSFTITHLEENIKEFRKLPNLYLAFAVTLSIYNILYLDDLLRWFDRIRVPTDELNISNAVVRPEFLNFQILPVELKKVALKRLESSTVIERYMDERPRRAGDPGKKRICESLQNEIFDSAQKKSLVTEFLAFNSAVDQLRGTNLLSVAPALKPLYI